MINRRKIRSPLLVLGTLVSSFAVAEVDTSDWLCEYCPFDTGYRANYSVGATSVSEDAARFGNATGYDEKGIYANVDGAGRYVDGAYRLDWSLYDLGLSSRNLQIDGGLQGVFGFNVGYREMPYRLFDTTQTIFSTAVADRLSLPADWVTAGTTTDFTRLAASLQAQDIESDRKILSLGADWSAAENIELYASFQRQNRDGINISGGSSFTQAALLPRWFDYETDQIHAGARFTTRRFSLGAAYYGSFFSNANQSLTWETPFVSFPGADQLRKSQAPDNDFQQVTLSGAVRASVWDTVVSLSAANGRGEQDQALLPYTINPNISTGPLPVNSLNARVDTLNYALTVSTRPLPKGRIRFSYRFDERDNKTLQSDWNRVIVDAFTSGDTEQNIPYSFERSSVRLSGELLVWRDIRLSGGYDRKVLKRDFQEVAEQTTDAGWGQIRWRPLNWLDLKAKGGTSERDIDQYDESVAISLGQNPLLRKYNLAYRFRSYGEFVISISPEASRWSVSSTLLVADDRYNKSLLGITDSEEIRATADLSISISDEASVFFLLGHENIDALQLGSEQSGVWDWMADHDDTFVHAGIGARWRPADSKFDLRFDYNRGAGETTIQLDSLSGGPSQLPVLKSTLDSVRIHAAYRWNERLHGTLNFRFERFELSDWAMISPDTLPTVLSLGAQPYDYDLWAIGIGIRYSFGASEIALTD